jgi:hypothetical protein
MRASFDGAGLTAGTSKAASPLLAPPSLRFISFCLCKVPGGLSSSNTFLSYGTIDYDSAAAGFSNINQNDDRAVRISLRQFLLASLFSW